MRRAPSRRAFAALALLTLAGCGGPSRVPVSGAVTVDGAPVDNGTITFVPTGAAAAGAPPKASARITDGKYAFEPDFGPMPGAYSVEITWDKKTGKKVSTGDADMRDETKQMLPAKYNAQTTLTADVKSGMPPLDFAVSVK